MFDRFTDRARKVMGLAREEAQKLQHQYIGTEHLLLGLAREGSGVAANVLRNLKVDPERIRIEISKTARTGPSMITMGQLPFTPRTKKVLELSSGAAYDLKHNYIGTEHLILGLICETDGIAAKVLLGLGLTPDAVRKEVLELVGATMAPDKKEEEDDPFPLSTVSFDDYQRFTSSTAIYPGAGTKSYEAIVYCALKGGGECGEFMEKLGKHMRKQGSITALNCSALGDDLRLALAKELGDRLWYIAQAADELGYSLSDIAGINVSKLTSRKARNVLIGEGDDR